MSYSFSSIRYIPDTLERCILAVITVEMGSHCIALANDAQLVAWVNHPDFAAIDNSLQAMVIDEINKRIAFKFCALCEVI